MNISDYGWFVTVEHLKLRSEEIQKRDKFIVYTKKSAPTSDEALRSFLRSLNSDPSYYDERHEIRSTPKKIHLTTQDYERLATQPTYKETDEWRCVRQEEVYYSHVEPRKGMPYILVSERELDEDIGTFCDKYFEKHKSIVIPGQALLVDLRGKEPRFESVPKDYRLPDHT
jgi:hypothetical protein